MKKLTFLFLAVLTVLLVYTKYNYDYYVIPEKSIRIRIIPNSNSIEDQDLKIKVKKRIEKIIKQDLENSYDIESSRNIITSNMDNYRSAVGSVLEKQNINQSYSVDYGYHYFPEKEYQGIKYKSGEYESLLITLGNGQGDNWWCVLFPPVCKFESEESNKENIEYSSYIKEMLKKYLK